MARPKFAEQVDMFGVAGTEEHAKRFALVEGEGDEEPNTNVWTYMPRDFFRMRHVSKQAYHIFWIPMQALDDLVDHIYYSIGSGVIMAQPGVTWIEAWKGVIRWAKEADAVLRTTSGWTLDLNDSTGMTGTQQKPWSPMGRVVQAAEDPDFDYRRHTFQRTVRRGSPA